jgi:hypothetical protein
MCLLPLAACTVGVLATVPVAYAQSHNVANPFVDHADSGDVIHVLPTPASIHSPRDTQATDAPVANGTAVYPASYGSGNLQYHGGRIMSSASYYAVYWNASVAMAVQDQIQAFVTSFPDNHNWDNSATDDYEVIQQYGAPTVFRRTLYLSWVLSWTANLLNRRLRTRPLETICPHSLLTED